MTLYSLPLNERILVLRNRANLTKKELAERIGVTPATITNYERGKCVPSQRALENLATVLGVSINMLICGFDDPTKDLPMKKLV